MVQLHVKARGLFGDNTPKKTPPDIRAPALVGFTTRDTQRSEDHQFLYDTPAATPLADLCTSLARLHNARLGLLHLCSTARQAATHTGSTPVEQELTSLRIEEVDTTEPGVEASSREGASDGTPAGQATPPLPHDAAQHLLRAVDDATAAVHKRDGMLAADDIVLWGPGSKALSPSPEKALLCDFIGRNDKSKVLVRLQTRQEGQPPKEGAISAEEQAGMLAMLRRRQQEAAALAAGDAAETDDAAWANPRALKAHFSGVGNVRIGGW